MTPALLLIVFRNLAYKRTRSVLGIIAVMLGTAVVSATFTTNVAIEESLHQGALAMVGQADLVLEAIDEQGIPQSAVDAVQALPDVELVAPQVQKRTFFRSTTERGFIELIGLDPLADPQIRPYHVSIGSFFHAQDERTLLVGKDWATRTKVQVGDALELMTNEGFQKFPVIGLLEEVDPGQRGSGGLLRVPLAVAQSAFGLQDRIQNISIKLRDPRSVEQVKQQLENVLPGLIVIKETARVREELEDSISDIRVVLLAFGAVGLLAGGFLVFNTLSLTVEEQTHEIGLLRALGAGTGLIRQVTIVQGLVLGVGGGVLGAAIGQALAWALVFAVSTTEGIPAAGFPFSGLGLVASLLVGVVITLVASLVPAMRAGAITTVSGLTGAGAATGGRSGRRNELATLAMLLLVTLVLVLPLEGSLRASKILALVALFPVFIHATRVFVPAITAAVALPVHRLFPVVGLLAERNVTRDIGRTISTVAGFLVSLALVVALFNSANSFTATGEESAQSLFPGEFTIVSPVEQSFDLLTEFQTIPGVEQVSPVAIVPVVWNSVRFTAAGVEPAHYFSAFQFQEGERTAAFRDMRRGHSLLVSSRLAQEKGIRVGDQLTLTSGDREASFTVAGVIARSFPTPDNYGALVLTRDDVETEFGASGFRFAVVSAAPDADATALEEELRRTSETLGVELNTVTQLRQSVRQGVISLIGLLTGLVLVGVTVGFLSIVNMMLMRVAQQAKELAILRAGGMTTSQIQQLAVVEAAILGCLGAGLGNLLGLLLTWILVDFARTADFSPTVTYSLPIAAVTISVGTLGAVVSAYFPARAAAATNIVDALRA